jgi:3-phytase
MRRPMVIGLVLALAAGFWPWVIGAQQISVRLLGQHAFESRRMFQDTTVGGLSGLTYDAKRRVYYAVSDDRGENQAPRFYTLKIEADETGIQDVAFVGVTFFDSDASTPGIQPIERGDSDMEDIQLLADDTLLVSSERDRENRPWVRRFALDGTLLGELPIPPHFETATESGPDGRPRVIRGIRTNLGFEGMALTPSNQTLYLANEQALAQDGPISTVESGTNVRLLRMEIYGAESRPTAEYVYPVDKAFAASIDPNNPSDNGLTSLVWVQHLIPGYDLLALERAFASGVGNDVNIFLVRLADATDVRDVDALPQPYTGRAATKSLLANIGALGIKPDNLEALALGPRLSNGHLSLIVMSDDNFSASGAPQTNQFILLEIDAP